MIGPGVNREIVADLFRVYLNAERIMLRKVTDRIAKGITIENGWAERKYAEVNALRVDLEKTIQALEREEYQKLQLTIDSAYKKGQISASMDMGVKPPVEIRVPLSVQRLILETHQTLQKSHLRILRSSLDVYRDVIAETATGVLTGVETRIQVTQTALNRFADRGITGMVDSLGRRWDMATYAEMAVRSTTGKAALQGHIDRQMDLGRDLVVISDHPSECDRCRPWEGRILSLSGNDPNHPALSTAISDGLFHPNCEHSMTGYIQGLTKIEKGKSDPEGYELSQKQRYNERQIRKWKRREIVALTPQEQQKASAKIKEWQAKQRELLKGTDVRRKYNRESITRTR